MTTKRKLRNRVDSLTDSLGYDAGGAWFVVPTASVEEPKEPQPDGELRAGRGEPEDGGGVIVPHHKPTLLRRQAGIRTVTYRQVFLSWVFMPDEVLRREITMRRENGEPLPEIVTEVNDV